MICAFIWMSWARLSPQMHDTEFIQRRTEYRGYNLDCYIFAIKRALDAFYIVLNDCAPIPIEYC